MIKRREAVIGGMVGVVLLIMAILVGVGRGADGKMHIVFCDVGQGDAILMRTPSGKDVLVDGGPDDKVLNCLSDHLPFWDRTIEMVFLTHPQADHLTGLISVLERYDVDYFVASRVANTSAGYKKLKSLVEEKGIAVENPYLGKNIDLGDGAKIEIIWPEREWLASHMSYLADASEIGLSQSRFQEDLLQSTQQGDVLGMASFKGDLNEASTMLIFSFGEFDVLLTGDADEKTQPKILKSFSIPRVEVLKVPHHGSRTGLLQSFLETVKPALAVISVGENNRYGHPAKEILQRLSGLGIETKRTDQDGAIEVVSDGETWEVK